MPVTQAAVVPFHDGIHQVYDGTMPSIVNLTVINRFRITTTASVFKDILAITSLATNTYADSFNDPYIYLGMLNDGSNTLYIETFNGVDYFDYLGVALLDDVDYVVALVKTGNGYIVYLKSSDGNYDWTPIITITDTVTFTVRRLFPGHMTSHQDKDFLRIFEAALTLDEIRAEYLSYFPVRTTNQYANWMYLHKYDMTDTVAARQLKNIAVDDGVTVLSMAVAQVDQLNSPPLFGNHLVYWQAFHRGDGSIAIPRLAPYRSNIWSAIGSAALGTDAAETVYPELVASESLASILVGEGPGGENVLMEQAASNNDGEFLVQGIGPLTSPTSNGWWNASKGRIRLSVQLTAAMWDGWMQYAPLFELYCPSGGGTGTYLNRFSISWGNNNDGTGFFDCRRTLFAGVLTTDSAIGCTRADTVDEWQDFDIRWTCGTVTNGGDDIASDGYITVLWRNRGTGLWIEIFNFQNIPFFLNDVGRDARADGSNNSMGVDVSITNWIKMLAFGTFGILPMTEFYIYDLDTVDEALDVEVVGADDSQEYVGEEGERPDTTCEKVFRRLGDVNRRIWSDEEIDRYLTQGLLEMTSQIRLIWDWTYMENLPQGFSYTGGPWEREYAEFRYDAGDGAIPGCANITAEWERPYWEALTGEDALGPASHTHPMELDFAADLGLGMAAVQDLPHRLTEIERAAWDLATIDAVNPRQIREQDSRYESIKGEVFGFMWRQDGPRAFRKVRVPAALADYYIVDGTWGIPRDVEDLEFVGADTEIVGTWGIARQIPGEHPIGPITTRFFWGTPRRPYADNKNVKVEHWRTSEFSCYESELPDRYVTYLIYYAMWKALWRKGPGNDVRLASWYQSRWTAGLMRIQNRIERQTKERVGRMGGTLDPNSRTKPPRPRLPWQYGQKVR